MTDAGYSNSQRNYERKRREALLRLARRSAAESSPDKVLRVLLTEAQQLLRATGGVVGLWDARRQLLVEYVTTLPGDHPPAVLKLGEGASGRAAVSRAPVIVNDYQRLEDAVPRPLRADIKAALAAPLLHEGRLLGVVVIVSEREDRQFNSEDADLLIIMAGMGASTLVALERKRTEERLRLETERLEQLTETTSDAVIVTDQDMRLLAWNRGAERLYGWSRQEVLGRQLPFIPEDRREATDRLWRRVLDHGENVANYEESRLTKDGRRIQIMATISPIRDESGAIVGVMGIAKDLSVLKEIEDQQKQLARLEERESIAMDLHDNTVQALHGAVLLLAAAERAPESDMQHMRAAMADVRSQLNCAIQELRSYLLDLRPRAEPSRGLSAGLAALAEWPRNALLQVEVEIDGAAESLLSPYAGDQLLAIAREATFNVIRHAQARTLSLRLTHHDGRMILSVKDDGRGFDTHDAAASGGQGLAIMSERARALGAQLTLATGGGSGTEVRVEVPLAPTPARTEQPP